MAKQTIGKDSNGVFHPGKGKPSGINKEEGLGLQATAPEKLDAYLDISDKYTNGEDDLDPSVHVRHPNRNTSKGKDVFKAKENQPASDKTGDVILSSVHQAVVAEELGDVLTREAFSGLAAVTADCCISIYLTAHTSGVEVNEHVDPTKFKNQLQEVSRLLIQKGFPEAAIHSMLQPGFDLLRDDSFWTKQSPGLAVFITPSSFQYVRMRMAPEESLTVNHNFYLTPFVPSMRCKEYFYLLVLSKKSAKLFRADAWGMERVPVELPQGIDEVKRLSEGDATTFRSGSTGPRAPRGSQEGSYHGTGGGNPDDKENLLVYFEAVDDILWAEVFNKENAPLLLAAVEYEIPIYRSACNYHNIWPLALTGSREHQDIPTLYRDAREIMQPHFEEKEKKALDLYMNNMANAKTSSIAEDVIPAAYYSQISHLFVARGEHIWGYFDVAGNVLNLHASSDEGGEELLDQAVIKTLANGGEVYLLPREKMPADSSIAAVFRY